MSEAPQTKLVELVAEHYFVGIERSCLFRERKSLKLSCAFLYKMIYIFHCRSPVPMLQ
jgi:hypothetical protein